MKKFDLKYGLGTIKVSVPSFEIMGVLSGRHMPPVPEASRAILKALKQPIDSLPLSKIIKKGEKVAIVVSDYPRYHVSFDAHLFCQRTKV